MTGPLKNARHEKFAQELAKGRSQVAAYVKAGFKGHDSAAARLFGNVRIRERVAELQAAAAKKATVTAADIIRQLDQDRSFARKLKVASAAVSATLGKAKVAGLMTERHEHTGRNGGPIEYRDMSDDEIAARIAARMAELGKPDDDGASVH